MSYKVIEKNEYGIRVRNYSEIPDCKLCKNHAAKNTCNRSECAPNSYYLPDSEAEKLESENQLMNTTIDDLYIESKCYFEVKKKLDDTQEELIDLRCELRVEKEKSKALEEYSRGLELKVNELEEEKSTTVNRVFDDVIQIEYAFCNKCNWQLDNVLANENFCPSCGRKIKK